MQEQNKIDAKPVTEPPGLLFEMIRSFVTLSTTLNLSRAVDALGSTRQTVRRHISQLEEMMGGPLFFVEDRRYHLTELGQEALPEAQDIISRCRLWARGQVRHRENMPLFRAVTPNGGTFIQQQCPIDILWQSDRPLLRTSLKAWVQAGAELESESFRAIRPYVMVFRNSPNGWVCVELGEQSSYVTWFGRDKALSSIGRILSELPGGDDFARLLSQPFHDVERERGIRLDHIYTQIPRLEEYKPEQICYERLLLGSTFPDGSFALVSVVDRHNNLRIRHCPKARMAPEFVMEFDAEALNSEH